MKIELTVTSNYVDWGEWEGFRELFQNAKDEDERGFKMEVEYKKDKQELVIRNIGTVLDRDSLLLGYSDKRESILRGKFGEGYKLGVMALIKTGHLIEIRTKGEKWVPAIERSEKFTQDVLVFHITNNLVYKNEVIVTVQNVSESLYEKIKQKVLFLSEKEEEKFSVYAGDILLSPNKKGNIYIGGLFVNRDENLHYGYDFEPGVVEIDRDRRMVSTWDMLYKTSSMWRITIGHKDFDLDKIFGMLQEEAPDIKNICWSITESDLIVKKWKSINGEKSFPVENEMEVEKLSHIDCKPVIVTKSMRAALVPMIGSIFEYIKKNEEKIVCEYKIFDLSQKELQVYNKCINLVRKAMGDFFNENIKLVLFNSNTKCGRFSIGDKIISLAKSLLASEKKFLSGLIHEQAHHLEIELGEKFEVCLELIWEDVYEISVI